jgi:hypothetical protein
MRRLWLPVALVVITPIACGEEPKQLEPVTFGRDGGTNGDAQNSPDGMSKPGKNGAAKGGTADLDSGADTGRASDEPDGGSAGNDSTGASSGGRSAVADGASGRASMNGEGGAGASGAAASGGGGASNGSAGEGPVSSGNGGSNSNPSGGGGAGSGLSCLDAWDCAVDEYCDDGVCKPDTCLPGTSYCDGNDVMECDRYGGGYSFWGSCQVCTEYGDFASCEPGCAPGAEFCIPGENLLRLCNADQHSSEVVEDCAASGQVCVGSGCYPVVCEPGTRSCDGNSIVECKAQGNATFVPGSCTSGRYCDEEALACRPQICSPNTLVCDDTIATRCNEFGSGYQPDGVDCADTDEECVNGACKPVVCDPDMEFCQGNDVRLCGSDGTSSSPVLSCTTLQYCDPQAPSCVDRECTPNLSWCEDNVGFTCDALGAGTLDAGTDCGATGQFCLDGECLDLDCLPDSTYCDGQVVRKCNATGTGTSSLNTCSDQQYCEDAACHNEVCLPDYPDCDGDRAAICNANGSGYLDGGDVCGASESCLDGTCTDALFWEGFEDHQPYDWGGTIANPLSDWGLSSGANGSNTSLSITRVNATAYGDGLYHLFDAVSPTVVRWWAMSTIQAYDTAYFDLTSDTNDLLVRVYLSGAQVYVNGVPTGVSYSAAVWYPFELDIDWVAGTLDCYFDSQLIETNVPLINPGTAIDRLDLYAHDQGATAKFDEIEFR